LEYTIEEMVAEEDKVAFRWTAKGTHEGEMMGIPPTSAHITILGIGIFRIADGQIAESWTVWDQLGMLEQFGVIPSDRVDYTWGMSLDRTGDPGEALANEATSLQIYETIWNLGELDTADEIISPDYVMHDPANPGVIGLDGFKQIVGMYRSAFPDLNYTIEDVITEGDIVVTRWSGSGTNTGMFMGLQPTGRHVEATGISIDRFADGKNVESWNSADMLTMLQQLGIVPPLGPPAALNPNNKSIQTWARIKSTE
jgi:predicted ester cyclase